MMISPRCLAVLFLALPFFPPASSCAGDELETRIRQVLERPEYRHSHWGLLVVDADGGKAIFQHNADQLFFPASVTKLFTCAAALVELGADHRFRTPVYRRGEVVEGTLKGDLILVAKGDPTLGGRTDGHGQLAFKNSDHTYVTSTSTLAELPDTDPLGGLRDLARQVRHSGIREVEGEVLIDNRLYEPSRATGSGPKLFSPIIVNDNLLDLIVTPAHTVGERATIRMRPDNGFSQVDVLVQTAVRGAKPRITVERVGPDRYVLRGRIPLGSKPLVRICSVADSEQFARALFIETLRREGVRVSASPLRSPSAGSLPAPDAYAGLTQVAQHESPPLSELVKIILKVSHNLYASALPLVIAVKHGKRTLADGMALEGKALAKLGIAVEDIALESGAGGGGCDRVTPRAVVQLLRAMARRPDFPVFRAALPVLGEDGTLASAVGPDSPARGKVMAKTGSYLDDDLLNDRPFLGSKSLAGVMTTKNGRQLAFAMFVNDVPLPRDVGSAREGKVLGRLCEIIYEHCSTDIGGR